MLRCDMIAARPAVHLPAFACDFGELLLPVHVSVDYICTFVPCMYTDFKFWLITAYLYQHVPPPLSKLKNIMTMNK